MPVLIMTRSDYRSGSGCSVVGVVEETVSNQAKPYQPDKVELQMSKLSVDVRVSKVAPGQPSCPRLPASSVVLWHVTSATTLLLPCLHPHYNAFVRNEHSNACNAAAISSIEIVSHDFLPVFSSIRSRVYHSVSIYLLAVSLVLPSFARFSTDPTQHDTAADGTQR